MRLSGGDALSGALVNGAALCVDPSRGDPKIGACHGSSETCGKGNEPAFPLAPPNRRGPGDQGEGCEPFHSDTNGDGDGPKSQGGAKDGAERSRVPAPKGTRLGTEPAAVAGGVSWLVSGTTPPRMPPEVGELAAPRLPNTLPSHPPLATSGGRSRLAQRRQTRRKVPQMEESIGGRESVATRGRQTESLTPKSAGDRNSTAQKGARTRVIPRATAWHGLMFGKREGDECQAAHAAEPRGCAGHREATVSRACSEDWISACAGLERVTPRGTQSRRRASAAARAPRGRRCRS